MKPAVFALARAADSLFLSKEDFGIQKAPELAIVGCDKRILNQTKWLGAFWHENDFSFVRIVYSRRLHSIVKGLPAAEPEQVFCHVAVVVIMLVA